MNYRTIFNGNRKSIVFKGSDFMKFVPRLSKPEKGNPFYNTIDNGGYSWAIKGNPLQSGLNVLSNCVGYAFGRFHEIQNNTKMNCFNPINAENIFKDAQNHGMKTGNTPKLGAAIVWQKGATLSNSDGAGHIAIVEQINSDGSIVTSESGWGCSNPWWLTTRKNDGNWGGGSAYKFLGFIYQPDDTIEDDEKENTDMREVFMNGIDVSAYQTNVDYNKVKNAGYEFVIIRAGYGRVASQKDKEFETHYKNAKAAGLHVGAYWYNYAVTPEDALTEAKVCAEILKGKQFDMPIYYDIEEQKTFNTGRDNVDSIAKTFCNYMESQGFFCGIYGGEHLVKNLLYPSTATRYAFWYAQYLKNPRYSGAYGLWQYSIAGAGAGNNPFGVPPVPGVSGQCDVDYCYENYPERIKRLKLNGYQDDVTPTEPDVTPEPVDNYPEPTRTLKEGMEGDDVKWLQKELTRLGYFNDEISGKFDVFTLGAVLAFQKKNNLEVDGLVGPATRKAIKSK